MVFPCAWLRHGCSVLHVTVVFCVCVHVCLSLSLCPHTDLLLHIALLWLQLDARQPTVHTLTTRIAICCPWFLGKLLSLQDIGLGTNHTDLLLHIALLWLQLDARQPTVHILTTRIAKCCPWFLGKLLSLQDIGLETNHLEHGRLAP